ncbi:hypothetical protein GCM10027290_16720 [Micromonospora sonneratiae]|uniref:Peptidase inhibitor family I36 n=1 Tax=Micromonospora sonneratiae TaxID=1184706 RepID=A0ABW3YFI3_9ACTN
MAIRTAFATLAALSCLVGATALAAAPATATAGADPSAQHCVVNLDSQKVACAADPQQARQLSDVGPTALTIAIFYAGTGYTGATHTWVQSRRCTPGYDAEWQWDNLAEIGWNNRLSSVRTYNRCDVKLYDGFNFKGASSVWIDGSSNLGKIGSGWNNRASSVKFS